MKNSRDFTVVKESQVHGSGVFAKKVIPKGTRIFEYKGLRVSKEDLATDLIKGLTSMIYVLNLNEITAIDGERGGNEARFINHSCSPNCEVMYFNEIPYIYAMKEILEDEELNFDYKLGFYEDVELSAEEKKARFPCNCGSQDCRGTLIKN